MCWNIPGQRERPAAIVLIQSYGDSPEGTIFRWLEKERAFYAPDMEPISDYEARRYWGVFFSQAFTLEQATRQ